MGKRESVWRRPELRAVTDYAEDFVQLLDCDFRHLFVNRSLADALGREPDAFAGKSLAEAGLPEPICALWELHLKAVLNHGGAEKLTYRLRLKNGLRELQTLIAPVKDGAGTIQALTAITRDVTEWKQAETLHASQIEVMRQLAAGASLQELMATMVRLVEENAPGRFCSILLLSEDGTHLVPGHAPHLPPALIESLCREPIGPGNGCCGTAAHQRAIAVAPDLATDPAWAPHRAIVAKHGLKACWSHPITAQDGTLLGTFAMYHTKARRPFPVEISVVNEAALAAGIAIQHWRTQDSLLETRERFQALTENAANIVIVTDMAGTVRYCSPASGAILGRPPEEVVGESAFKWVHPDDVENAVRTFTRLRQDVGAQLHEFYRYQHENGSWRLLEVSARGRFNHRGEYLGVVSARDVTDREGASAALRASQERLDRALEASDLGMWEWDLDRGDFHIDERCARNLGYALDQLRPHWDTIVAIIHPDDALRVTRYLEAHLRGTAPFFEYQARMRQHDGIYTWVAARGQVERDGDGGPVRLSGTLKNIDAEKRVQESLETANTQIQLLLEATDEGIVGLDGTGAVSFANPAAVRLLACRLEDLLGVDFHESVRHTREDGAELPRDQSPIYRCVRERTAFRGTDDFFWRKDGTGFPIDYSVSPIGGDAARGAVLVFRDVSDKRLLAQQLQHQALHDPLTGLMNRRGFENKLMQLLTSARTQGMVHALCYVDLDHFKLVNDTCGHAAGDELLRQLPQVIQPLVRKTDMVARLGGDEFAILLEECPLEQAARIAENVRDAIRDFRFVWQYRTFTIGASIGVVGVTSESHGLVSVLGAADTACYVAKDQGPNHVHVSYPHDLAIIRRRGEMRWVARIKTALEENQFRLHYQSMAKLDEPEAAPQCHELLIRLLDTKGDLILPGAFLQAAERYQLMPQIDDWVVENALKYLGQNLVPDARFAGHRFGINLSGESMRDTRLLKFIQDALARHQVPATMLYFEVTETAAIQNLGSAVEFMRGLKEMGCRLALDDFGSGMSSFSYLKHLPVDYLKIDGAFIKDIVNNPVDQAIVRAVQAVGKQMGLQTIAEYVETRAILETLRGMGLNYGQGHAIARPMPLEDFPVLQQAVAASA